MAADDDDRFAEIRAMFPDDSDDRIKLLVVNERLAELRVAAGGLRAEVEVWKQRCSDDQDRMVQFRRERDRAQAELADMSRMLAVSGALYRSSEDDNNDLRRIETALGSVLPAEKQPPEGVERRPLEVAKAVGQHYADLLWFEAAVHTAAKETGWDVNLDALYRR